VSLCENLFQPSLREGPSAGNGGFQRFQPGYGHGCDPSPAADGIPSLRGSALIRIRSGGKLRLGPKFAHGGMCGTFGFFRVSEESMSRSVTFARAYRCTRNILGCRCPYRFSGWENVGRYPYLPRAQEGTATRGQNVWYELPSNPGRVGCRSALRPTFDHLPIGEYRNQYASDHKSVLRKRLCQFGSDHFSVQATTRNISFSSAGRFGDDWPPANSTRTPAAISNGDALLR